jgi:hypothetical protein
MQGKEEEIGRLHGTSQLQPVDGPERKSARGECNPENAERPTSPRVR